MILLNLQQEKMEIALVDKPQRVDEPLIHLSLNQDLRGERKKLKYRRPQTPTPRIDKYVYIVRDNALLGEKSAAATHSFLFYALSNLNVILL